MLDWISLVAPSSKSQPAKLVLNDSLSRMEEKLFLIKWFMCLSAEQVKWNFIESLIAIETAPAIYQYLINENQ